jgi:hypothetical protein
MDTFGFGYRPRRIRLLDQELHLDPDIQRMLLELETQMAHRHVIQLWLQPDWNVLQPTWQTILSVPTSHPAGPSFTPGAGPDTPRPGELSDITGAIYKLPAVQGLVERAHDEGLRQLRLLRTEWNRSSPGERAVMVTMSGIVLGSSIGILMANQPTRQAAFDLIKGRDIPVPGVTGLSFQILERGGAITVPLGVPGLSGTAKVQVPEGASHPNYNVMVNLNLMDLVESR